MSTQSKARFVIDSTQSGIVTVEDERGTHLEIRATELPKDCRIEGAVLDVPVNDSGKPVWRKAIRNPEVEASLQEEALDRLRRLRASDPGGDIAL